MQVALITPPALLSWVPDTHYNLVLAQELHQSKYREYYKNHIGTVIMDNGAAEGEMLGDGELLTQALSLEPDVIVCPDHMGDIDKTIDAVIRFRRTAEPFKDFNYYAVAQGASVKEVVECAKTFLNDARFSWLSGICLPRLMLKFGRTSRVYVAEHLGTYIGDRSLHCLGSGAWTREVIALADIPWVTGIDTSAPVAMGIKGQDIVHHPYKGRPDDYFHTNEVRGTTNIDLIRHNVRTYLGWANA